MKKKIISSMFLIAILTAFVTTVLTTIVMFDDTKETMHDSTKMESFYVIEAYDEMGVDSLKDFAAVTDSRVTLIAPDGTVVFDSGADESRMENHSSRPEIVSAFEIGTGENTRYSDTLDEETYYYAVLLNDGNVLRLSNTTGTFYNAFLHTIPWMFATALLSLGVAALVSRYLTASIVKPINKLNIDAPAENVIYPELDPLLVRLENQRKQINDQISELEKKDEMRREFTANVSHEMKTPLTSISGYAEIIKHGIAKPEDVGRFAGKIYGEAQRMIDLVGDILKLSHLDEGAADLEKENVDLKVLCSSVALRFAHMAESKGVSISVTGSGAVVLASRSMLEEVVSNLCDNAIKYNRPGGTVNINVESVNGKAKLTISDTGIGIPAKDIDRVFERFYRVDKSHSRETGGTGLGLSIVKHGVQLQGGKIDIISEEGKGTSVIIEI